MGFVQPSAPGVSAPTTITPEQHGAAGDGVTDDTTALQAAVTAWVAAAGAFPLVLTQRYKTSKYILVYGGRGLLMQGPGTLIYPSDGFPVGTFVPTDSFATSHSMSQSGFVFLYCSDITLPDVQFQGGTSPASDTLNLGCGYYTRHCKRIRSIRCKSFDGHCLTQGDAAIATAGTGNSLAVSGTTVTMTVPSGVLVSGHVGRSVTLNGCTNIENNGQYTITAVPSSTTLQFTSAWGIAETSSFSWSINDDDTGCKVIDAFQTRARGSISLGNDAELDGGIFEWPDTRDRCSHPQSISISGTTVTLVDMSAPFVAADVGRYIKTSLFTSSGNNGVFQILTVDSHGGFCTFTNASAVAEAVPVAAAWWIMGGAKVGVGGGSGALSIAAGVVTLTVSTPSFSSNDLNAVIRTTGATSPANTGAWLITGVISSTQVTYANAGGVTEAFTGQWAIDNYDSFGGAGAAYGSSHCFYIFAGRSNINIHDATIKNCRKTVFKASGSSLVVKGMRFVRNYLYECANLAIVGADDSQVHSGIVIADNICEDIATNRQGWNEGGIVSVLGSRSARVHGNIITANHDSTCFYDGAGNGASGGFTSSRYVQGESQPIEDLYICDNQIIGVAGQTTPAKIYLDAINVQDVGLNAYYSSTGTLSVLSSIGGVTTMQLTDANAEFPQSLIGCSVTFVNAADSANNITATILSVGANAGATDSNTFTFVNNAPGIGLNHAAGTYRIASRAPFGSCQIRRNVLKFCASNGITTASNIAPQITDNIFAGLLCDVKCSGGDLMPYIDRNQELSASTQNARLRLDLGTSWPVVGTNRISGMSGNPSLTHDWGVGVGNSTEVDYHLQGTRVRCLPTQAKEQVVFAYGSLADFVDGDSITISGNTFVYKKTGPTGSQFNTPAGLIALINAIGGTPYVALDYGSQAFASGSFLINHILVHNSAATATDNSFNVTTSTCNPNVLVILRNVSNASSCKSRGGGLAGPVAASIVAWSQCTTLSGVTKITPDNVPARALLLAAGPPLPVKNITDTGCNEEILVGNSSNATGGTEEFRVELAAV